MSNFITCPNCDIKFDAEEVEATELNICPNCGYEWFDDDLDEIDFGDTIFDINSDFEDQ